MQRGRNFSVLQGERGLDDACRAGSSHQMAHIALDRTDATETHVPGAISESPGQAFDFYRVTQGCRCAVCLHITDAACLDTRIALGHGNHCCLALAAGCREAGFAATVIVDCAATDQSIDRVAIGQGLGQTLQQYHGSTITKDRALCVLVERTGASIRRQHRTFLVAIAAAWRADHGRRAGKRHVALAGTQAVDRLADGDQRRGTGRMQADGRTIEVQLVRNTRSDIVLLVSHHDLEGAQFLD